MDPAFWRTRWAEGKTLGFHEGAPNSFLVTHGTWLDPCLRILVPLCGKAEDLAYLAGQNHDVVGIELVEDAVKQFFAAHNTTPTIEPGVGTSGALTRYSAGAITILCGDFFAVTEADVGPIDGIYDRAAIVALPPDMRLRYVDHLRKLAPHAKRDLLVAIEYPEGAHPGPPFCVDQAEVRRHYANATVTEVGYGLDPQGRLEGRMAERCYTIAF